MRNGLLLAVSLSFLAASGVLGGCGDDNPATPGGAAGQSGERPSLEGVIYEAGATDEALVSVLGVAARSDDAKGPAVSEPAADGTSYPRTAAPTFGWGAVVANASPSKSLDSPWERALNLVSIRSAHAHGNPNTGLVYLLEITDTAGTKILRVFTTKTSYTPSAGAWTAVGAATGPLSLRVIGARVENNDFVSGGGPFVATAARTFSVAP